MANRLARESSPYLLQHADNPVDWWPWCDEALALARERDFPVLLSIGYSACHWCHVMAHESFADAEVAAVMNRHFINIKVDREERPDLDHIYQAAHQLLAGRAGGWPLTVFLTPDGMPFFAGTYFPPRPRHRLPGFIDVLRDVAQAFAAQRGAIETQNAKMREELARLSAPPPADDVPAAEPVAAALRKELERGWDRRHGGFGDAPKFPRPTDLAFLLRHAAARKDAKVREMALTTLVRMAEGGLFDQLGGGFFRYSTDERWCIPHFEKMLYDNAALLGLYAEAWTGTREPLFAQVVERTVEWAVREMRAPDGGFYAALDADSEGEEGRFYTWTRDAVRAQVSTAAQRLVERHWGLDGRPNFEGKAWHLHVAEPLEKSARKARLEPEVAREGIEAARRALFAERERRVRPGRDDKILTAWNALMIGGLARAARHFGRADWLALAREALARVRRAAWREGRLLAVSDEGGGRLDAYLDDHAFLLDAVLELLQTDFRVDELEFARVLADTVLEAFEDGEQGGFFFTRHDHERLITRLKPAHDNATAAGNGVAVQALLRLGHILGEVRYLDAAERALRAFGGILSRGPLGCAGLVSGLCEYEAPSALVVLSGPEAAEWQRRLVGLAVPGVLCLVPRGAPEALPPTLRLADDGVTTARLCRGTRCEPPVFDFERLEALVREG